MLPEAPDRVRWVVFSAMASIYFTFGVMVMSIPPMVGTVRADLGISRTAMGLALGAWALIYVVSAPPAGRIIDRIGLHRSLLVGALFVAGSGFARAAAQGLGTLWMAVALFGVGGPLVSASAPKLVAVWFSVPSERRLAVGLYTAAPAFGGVASLLLTNSVLLPALGDWRSVVVVYSMLAVVAGAVWWGVSTAAPPEPTTGVAGSMPLAGEWRSLLASPGVRLAFVLGLGSFFANHGLAAWLPDVLETDSELTASAASNWTALSLGVGIAAGLTLPRFADAERRGRIIGGVMGVMALSLFVLAVAPPALAVVAAVVLGVRSALVPLVILVLMESEGVNATNMGLANGLWFSVVEIGGTTGPLSVGVISDTSVGFGGAMLLLGAVLLALGIVAVTWDGGRAGLSKPGSIQAK